jgi:EAL domain-containing protein (putative c-di-GMP-specific phosphodiesterase class I)/PleD family two-component response regulator
MNEPDRLQGDERGAAFLRRLPLRAEVLGRRLQRFALTGWDINGLALLRSEAAQLREGSLLYGVEPAAEPLQAIGELLAELLEREQLPDLAVGERLLALAQTLNECVPPAPAAVESAEPDDASADADFLHSSDAVAASAPIHAAAEALTVEQDLDVWGDGVAIYGQVAGQAKTPRSKTSAAVAPTPGPAIATVAAPAATRSKPRAANSPGAPGLLQVPRDFRIYHLTGYGGLALELDQCIEAQGLEIELLEDVDELNELLSALPADLVLVDASFSARLEDIGASVRLARGRNSKQRLLLVAIVEVDDIALRLSARRAGVDALVVAPADASDVIRRLQALVDPEREEPFRILIVEDDRSQALFAEGILRNAGMDSLVVLEALGVMPALLEFAPDLILMDLNMPGANGIELTALIREQDAHAHTPIVFLSGESSEDLQFDAIDAGGDDFLSKPIRPRHLISAVQTRVRRHRQQESRRVRRPEKDAATGLVYRKTVLEQLDACLHDGQQAGGLVFVEVEGLALLRERIGLTALEILLGDVSRLLTGNAGELPATRFGDGSYLLLDRRLDESGLEALAVQLRQALMQNPFQALGHPLRLRLSVGVCAFKHGFSESGAMINAVEKVAREARSQERGVRRYEPPQAAETLREAALLAQVRDAIDQDSLVLLFQPVVAVTGSDVEQYQVLLRLRDNTGKLHAAAEIIPMAERSSLIVDLDRWVMSQALALIQERQAEQQSLRLFVTQSPLTLAADDQADWLRQQLRDSAVPGSALVMELRLDDVLVHAVTVRQFAEALAGDGVQFCLSQFEAGVDAEALASRLPLAFVKLARKYTAGSLTPALRDELKVLVDLVHRRGLKVIGHGVEDAQAAATLWMSGIDYIQGNLVQQADQDVNFDFNQTVL